MDVSSSVDTNLHVYVFTQIECYSKHYKNYDN